ncbi:Bloom syndrome protein -like protein [Caligus rogercresseyi]|uniref:Bloom syndrome protein -like protein n=1 Tax=Caligus rogercresseyi TaxID=217165 RepID=A0A7T8KHZ0_CALRO|nr:Bloom syndrome protein -like protein [Caligus rogercresseyi]
MGIPADISSGALWPAAENIRKAPSPHAPNHIPLRDSREVTASQKLNESLEAFIRGIPQAIRY